MPCKISTFKKGKQKEDDQNTKNEVTKMKWTKYKIRVHSRCEIHIGHYSRNEIRKTQNEHLIVGFEK